MSTSAGTGATRSDAELIRASRSDPAAFEVLFDRHSVLLDRWLVAQTGDGAVAYELLAETFAQAWRGAGRFRGTDERSGAAWLYGIARNLLRQHYRQGRVETRARQRLAMATLTVHEDDTDEITCRIDARELAPAVREAFAELTSEQQAAIAFRVVEELSYEEVAARLRCSTITARTRVFRGLQILGAAIAKGAQP
ncbi:MAG TPA: RNA polymerase sigma factor [Solirubrobacteraceae bacterium]|jgi:RNA polymerase sigma factor (sigma-70 family)|nr:RNA polymerase sigma factor [Solirubrobacteraceae bacterium]